jgi:pimeloyl-ACP methyl ester carboxylesterase
MTFPTNPLPPALSGEIRGLQGRCDRLSYYCAGRDSVQGERPLLLVHSINAAAGAHEVRPLYEHYAQQRPVYAPDLPGYGKSDRSDREYSARLMTDAVLDMVDEIQRLHGDKAIDVLGLSLSCEFVSRAAVESADSFSSVSLVSPTALNRNEPLRGATLSSRGMAWLLKTFKLPGLGTGLFRLLSSRASVRYFLQKTWGSRQIDEQMFEYSFNTAKVAGAHHAPFYFLSGFLFSADAFALYESLSQPVWLSHGVRGDFTDYRLEDRLLGKSNWSGQVFQTGALPFFEATTDFIRAYDQFLQQA